MPYRLSELARVDLKEISCYVGARDSGAAERLLDEFVVKFQFLYRHPKLGIPRDDLMGGLRCSLVRPYVIFYQIAEDGLEIMRVVHGSRDIDAIRFQ